jgi:branched-subunit amino acid aminotransferase/4-amino-4-deoxychorismate lyase
MPDVEAFWAAAIARLPRRGGLFPRVEVDDQRHVQLRIRAAPPRGTEIRAWVPGRPDVRQQPRRKGPDLPRLGKLRSAATEAGADDALLTSVEGLVLESGSSSLLWWDDDRLFVPDPHLPVLPGVTARLIREAAASDGVEVVPVRCHLDALASRETWLVNALHGIRPVVEWVGTDVPAGLPERAPRWRKWWQDLAVPCPG